MQIKAGSIFNARYYKSNSPCNMIIVGNDINQFKQTGQQVIRDPPELKSGNPLYPFAKTTRAITASIA